MHEIRTITSAKDDKSPSKVAYMVTADDRGKLSPPDELAALMRRVAENRDVQAFAALFRFYAPRLKSFLLRQGFNDGESEDLVQETMLNIWRRAESFDSAKAGVSTWIFTIARNCGIDRRRRSAHMVFSPEVVDMEKPDPDPTAEDRMIGWENEAAIRTAMSKLSEEQAVVIRMSYFSENSQTEIAARLGIPLGTVKSRARLALQHLRQILTERT